MSNVNNLTSKILKDAEERKSSILAKAEEEKNKIITKKRDEANRLKTSMIEKAKLESATRKERILSSAELKVRNEKLLSKGKVIDEVFNMSVENLCQMNENDFRNFVKSSILSLNIEGDENIILNTNGKKAINEAFIKEINNELKDKGNLKLSQSEGKFRGGFILEKNGIEINYTFEALVQSLREELEFEVANILFN
ncbi:V-type ATP synthase subunit E family protein [Clostridium thermobutyricum]|uniref:V-type ATP synthase subunit E n=1 Tax=Clostridium thermobutyricum TaxID=29372 RepID=UPI00294220DB|nr:V-type ATP synthase subunit E family protein [Clostridium thermobutyricum]